MKHRSKHLDLGCGINPRNPFKAEELYGVDIIEDQQINIFFKYTRCNLTFEKLPFPNDYFDSVSAYDFFEPIPRVHNENYITRFPFIEIMSEIFRVLKPGGKLIALTPVYPKESAFIDPTHVNFISKSTHKYFTKPHCWAKMYGFTGKFELIRANVVNFEMIEKSFSSIKLFLLTILNILYPKRKQHILWLFSASKI